MLAFLHNQLGKFGEVKYGEIRFHDRKKTEIIVRNGELKKNSVDNYCGIGIRVFINCWGFAATSSLKKEAIEKAIQNAITAAKLVTKSQDIEFAVPKERLAKGLFLSPPDIDSPDISLEEKIEIIQRTEREVRNSSQIRAATVQFLEYSDHKYILTSDGAEAEIKNNRVDFKVMAVAGKDNELMNAREGRGISGKLMDIFKEKSPEEIAQRAAKRAIELLKAPYPPGGEAMVILDPSLVGFLVHEAIGHTVEADHALAGAAAQGKINQKVASELITLVDNGLPPYNNIRPAGILLVDDEGILSQRTVIIENGILKSYLHSRESAFRLGAEPTGNARAFEYSNQPIIRMSNTYVEPGNSSFEEIVGKTKDGYLMKKWAGGMADLNGEFMFSAEEIYKINNGKIGELLRGTSFSGQAFEVLKTVDMVSKDFEINMGDGHCGKFLQQAKVDGGGPYLLCKVKIGGK